MTGAGRRSTITVFLLDDHELARRGVRRIIETDEQLEVIGEAETGHDGIALVPHLSPDVAVLDLSLPDMTGVEVCREICANHPETRCLILTSFDDDRAMLSAVMAGAAGYVLKEIKGSGLLDAIHRVATGETLISERAARATVERATERADDASLRFLTGQERRVLDRIGEGKTNREISEAMGLMPKTVQNYVSNLLAKLGMARRAQAAAYVARLHEREDVGPR